MRTHRAFPALQPWAVDPALRELFAVEHLCAMRVEPVTRQREPAAFVDLTFSDGMRSAVVPLVYVDLAQLDVREADPLVFPQAVADAVDAGRVGDVIALVAPDLERRIVGGLRDEELIVYRSGSPVVCARERGFFGAAPLAVSLLRVAPAVYARRFTFGKYVTVYGRGAAELAAFVRPGAAAVTLVGDDDAEAAAWYGSMAPVAAPPSDVAIGVGEPPVPCDVTVRVDAPHAGRAIPVIVPVPADVMISFSEDDGPVASRFGVAALRDDVVRTIAPAAGVAAIGGSSGRVALVVRHDGTAVPDGDIEEAAAFANALRNEGFTVLVTGGIESLDAFAPDLIHLFGVRPGVAAREVADWALERRVPLAVHAYYEDPARGAYWGALVAPYCFGYSADDRSVMAYLDLLAKRAVEVDGISAASVYAPPAVAIEESERVLRVADLVFVNSEREREVVAALRHGRPTIVVPPLLTAVAGAGLRTPLGAFTGVAPFVLIDAPIGPLGNQLNAMRAVAEVGVPLVLTGPIEDPIYAERVREFATDMVRIVPARSASARWSLYRSAAVYADVGWAGRGQSRVSTAAVTGAAVVVAQTRWLELNLPPWAVVDPADVHSIARGIGEAWDAASRGGLERSPAAAEARERGSVAPLAIIAAYAKIGQTV